MISLSRVGEETNLVYPGVLQPKGKGQLTVYYGKQNLKERKKMINPQVRVYIVLEHHHGKHDAVVHGVYTSRKIANFKVASLAMNNPKHGYLCVLQKTTQGPKLEFVNHNKDTNLYVRYGVYK